MPVSVLDLVVLGVVFISAILAMMRGFTREVLAIGSWIAAAAAAFLLYKQVLPYVHPYISNETAARAVAIGIVFLVTLIVVSLITVRVSDFILDSKIGALDRTLGFLFGAARGLLICIIGFGFYNWLAPDPVKQPEWVKTARTRAFLQSSEETLRGLLPADTEEILKRYTRKPEGESTTPPEPVPPPPAPTNPQQRSDATWRPDQQIVTVVIERRANVAAIAG